MPTGDGRVGLQALNMDPAGGAMFYLKSLIWDLAGFCLPFLGRLFFLLCGGISHRFGLINLARNWLCLYAAARDVFCALASAFGDTHGRAGRRNSARISEYPIGQSKASSGQSASQRIRRLAGQRINLAHYLFVHCSLSHCLVALLLILTLPSTYMALRADYIFSQSDTRTEALNGFASTSLLAATWPLRC